MEWTPAGEEPVLYMSPAAVIEQGKPIRGGIPICWPWFGPHAADPTKPAHGFVRTERWSVDEVTADKDRVELVLGLAANGGSLMMWPHEFALRLRVSVGPMLEVGLTVQNTGVDAWTMTGALHTYLCVGDVTRVIIRGLHGTEFFEGRLSPEKRRQQGAVRIAQEVDRVYVSDAAVEVEDPAQRRTLVIEKSGSHSTVVWNPWIEKSKRLPDLPDNAYPDFLCIETANAGEDSVVIDAGGEHRLLTRLQVRRGGLSRAGG